MAVASQKLSTEGFRHQGRTHSLRPMPKIGWRMTSAAPYSKTSVRPHPVLASKSKFSITRPTTPFS